jgi:ABC-type sugar transport system ATPase subunit
MSAAPADDLRGEEITKVFADGTRALQGVSFVARAGKVLALLGPSGCGKSTLLRIVAGLDQPTSGRLTLGERSLDGTPPGDRDVGFVFQNYALYPHLSVARNLSLALEARRLGRAEIEARVRETARMLDIGDLLDRRPGQLSGGQQQRVALGRALVRRPRLYLLDEPLSNLDALLREGMRSELKALFRAVGATALYVTHDQAEAMSLADEVAVLRAGRVLQCAPPLDLYRRPTELFVATFVGSPRLTVWRGRREQGRLMIEGGPALAVPSGLPAAGELLAGIRPEDVEIADQPRPGWWEAARELSEPLGATVLLTLRVGQSRLRALAAPRDWPSPLWVRWPPERIHWFDAASERRLEP